MLGLIDSVSSRLVRLVAPELTAEAAPAACVRFATTCENLCSFWVDRVVYHWDCGSYTTTTMQPCGSCAG